MGKKSKKSNVGSRISKTMSRARNELQERDMDSAFQAMALMDDLPLEGQRDKIRRALLAMGTNCDENDSDRTGNGDQSFILLEEAREDAREIYSIGGDIHAHLTEGKVSEFAMLCLTGNVTEAQKMIDVVTKNSEQQPWSRNPNLKALLETRETSMRLSPLLLVVSAGKNVPDVPKELHVQIATLLLKYGANPTAKDVLGKTVVHYGAGAFATEMTLEVVGMCIEAAKSHHLVGQEIHFRDLKTSEMNGKTGVVEGFEAGRSVVFVCENGEHLRVKPENLHSATDNEKPIPLTDIQDRLGSLSLHEVIMQNRVDVADFLLNQHNASIYLEDLDGVSPFNMSLGMGRMGSEVCNMVMGMAQKQAAANRKAKKDKEYTCSNCQKELNQARFTCSRCKNASYCNADCQKEHWKQGGHKYECKEVEFTSSSIGVRLDPPPATESNLFSSTICMRTGSKFSSGGYQKPPSVQVDEKFVVKVQCMSNTTPILLYDQSRVCEFSVYPDQPGFKEILRETRKEMAWQGRKTFMKASFDKSGACTIFPSTAGVKSKYNW